MVKKNHIKLWFFILLPVIILSIIFNFWNNLFYNQKDELWYKLDSILVSNGIPFDSKKNPQLKNCFDSNLVISTLELNRDSLQHIYSEIHKNVTDTLPIWEMIQKPFLPSIEYSKLKDALNTLLNNKKAVVAGVTGAGKTTLIRTISKFVTGNPEKREKELDCVEEMGVQYHNQWIGYYEGKNFIKGRLLEFIENASSDTLHNYLFILDDIDKIYPGTFFGAEFWKELNDSRDKNIIDGYGEISLPDNFYLLSVTHEGVGSTIEFNDEHYRRLGTVLFVKPNYKELLLNVKSKIKKLNISFEHAKRLIYFFIKTNEIIAQKYGESHTLGQWSTITKYLKQSDFDKFKKIFIEHVNAFKPTKELTINDFEDIEYTMQNEGSLPNTFFLAKAYTALIDTGIFSELTVALVFAMFSAVFGWVFILRKKRYVKSIHNIIQTSVDKYKDRKIDYDTAYKIIIGQKQKLENSVLQDKVKYEIANFLFYFINEQLKVLDEVKKLETTSVNFLDTFEKYFEDGVINDSEYKSLTALLEGIRNQIDVEIYYRLKNHIEEAYSTYKKNL